MKKKNITVGGRTIKDVPYFERNGKEILDGEEVLEIEKILRRMKKEGLLEVNYREKSRA